MRIVGAAMLGIVTATAANAQVLIRTAPPGVILASDIDAPYYEDAPPPRHAPPFYHPRVDVPPPPAYGPPPYGPTAYAPPVLPIHEIDRIVRESGYEPLGAPQQRGPVYTVAVLDPDGADGRLVIDARNGRIVRFVRAYRYGARGREDMNAAYGPPSALPRIAMIHPTANVPLPKPRVAAAPPLPEKSAAITVQKPAIPTAPPAAVAAAQPSPAVPPPSPKPSFTPQPTQAMPPAQGTE